MPVDRAISGDEAIEVIKDYFNGFTHVDLVKKYDLSKKAIYNILYLKTYRNATIHYVNTNFNGSVINYYLALAQRRVQGLKREL